MLDLIALSTAVTTLEDSRGPQKVTPKADLRRLTCGASWPHLQASEPPSPTCQSLFATLILHHLVGCIYAITLSQFDPRAHVASSGLYKQAPAPLRHQVI
jgi:hypothetical protein